MRASMITPKALARTAGVLYLLLAGAAFNEGYVGTTCASPHHLLPRRPLLDPACEQVYYFGDMRGTQVWPGVVASIQRR
jgi:hypothetical protein